MSDGPERSDAEIENAVWTSVVALLPTDPG